MPPAPINNQNALKPQAERVSERRIPVYMTRREFAACVKAAQRVQGRKVAAWAREVLVREATNKLPN